MTRVLIFHILHGIKQIFKHFYALDVLLFNLDIVQQMVALVTCNYFA